MTQKDPHKMPKDDSRASHCYIDGKRNQGRQPKKWMNNVNEDIRSNEVDKQWFWCGTETNGNIK